MRIPPPEAEGGIRYIRKWFNDLRQYVIRTRVIPVTGWTETEAGVLPPGNSAAAGFVPQWLVSVRDDDGDWQCSVNAGWLTYPSSSSGGPNTRGRPSTFEGTTWPGTSTVWKDLPSQTGTNYVRIDITWTPYLCERSVLMEDNNTDTHTVYLWGYSPTFEDIDVTTTSNEGLQDPGFVTEGDVTEYFFIAKIDASDDPPTVTQYLEGSHTLCAPIVPSEISSGDGPLLRDHYLTGV